MQSCSSPPEFRQGLVNFAKHATWVRVKEVALHPGPVYERVYAATAPAHMLALHLEELGGYPRSLKVHWGNWQLLVIEGAEEKPFLQEMLLHASKKSLSLEDGLKHLSHWLYPR